MISGIIILILAMWLIWYMIRYDSKQDNSEMSSHVRYKQVDDEDELGFPLL